MSKILIIYSYGGYYSLRTREDATEKTLANAESIGLVVVRRKDIPDWVLDRTYSTLKKARKAAERVKCEGFTVQKLEAMS